MAGIAFLRFRPFYMGLRPGATTRANTSTSTCAAPSAGRQHVVDQYQAPTGNLDPVFKRDKKCPLDVIGALGSRPPVLLRGGTDTFEPAMRDGDPANRRYRAGKNDRLTVSSCPSPMQGYRN